MIVGILKEIKTAENRVSMTPTGVEQMLHHGHTLLVEKNAGKNSGYTNTEYANAGATIVETAAEIYRQADMVMHVKEPLSQEYDRAWVGNSQLIYNSAFTHYVEVGNIIQLARSAALAALHREESRGAHTRKDFSKRNDDKYLQHSLVHVKNDKYELSYRPVVMGKYQPEVRKY